MGLDRGTGNLCTFVVLSVGLDRILKLHKTDIVRRKGALTCTSTELTIKDGLAAEYVWEDETGSSRRSLSPN